MQSRRELPRRPLRTRKGLDDFHARTRLVTLTAALRVLDRAAIASATNDVGGIFAVAIESRSPWALMDALIGGRVAVQLLRIELLSSFDY